MMNTQVCAQRFHFENMLRIQPDKYHHQQYANGDVILTIIEGETLSDPAYISVAWKKADFEATFSPPEMEWVRCDFGAEGRTRCDAIDICSPYFVKGLHTSEALF